jgi:hypothetical protein
MLQTVEEQAQKLFDQGYRGVSNRHRIVSRVDQDIRTFVEHDKTKMRKRYKHKNWSSYDFLLSLPKAAAEDWFRRCLSKDKQVVQEAVYRALKRLEHSGGKAYHNQNA